VTVAEHDSPIERALRDHRDDPDARLVYADWLQGQGNPIGEYIALALQRGLRRDPKLEKRLAALESKLRLPLPDQAKLRWKHGMWSSIRIENAHDLTMGCLRDIGAHSLVRSRARFPALETVIVDQNLLTADGLGALRGAFQRVVVSTQRHPPAHRTSVLIQRNRRSLT
jgi:uncharacterized protein (TIGR02996 family)